MIRKGQSLYYAFFTRVPAGEFNGMVALRGLSSKRFRVVDYVRNHVFGEVIGPQASISVSFRDSLLLLVKPASAPPT